MRTLLITLLISLLLFAVIQVGVFSLYTLPPNAMESTLQLGDRVVVNKWSYGWRLPYLSDTRIAPCTPTRNDIILYNQPASAAIHSSPLALGRCIALPGDTLRYSDGAYTLNGQFYPSSPTLTRPYFYSSRQRGSLLQALHKHRLPDYGDIPVGDNYLRPLTQHQYTLLAKEVKQLLEAHHVDTTIEVIIPRPHTIVHIKPTNVHALYPVLQHELPGCKLQGNRLYLGGKEVRVARIAHPYYWVMSDNLASCADSRSLGVIPHARLVGRATYLSYSTTRTPWWKHLFTPL